MRTASVLVVLLIARGVAIAGHAIEWSLWSPVAYLWHDAAVAALFGIADLLFRRRRLMWIAYTIVVIYIAVNVPVVRVLSTPMTWTMWRAARGPLVDSVWSYVTPANIWWMTMTIAVGIAAPRVLRRASTLAVVSWLIPVVALGPIAAARVATHGAERNAWSAIAQTLRPRASAAAAHTGRRPLLATSLHGAAAGRHVVLVSLESTAAQYLGLYGADRDVMPNLSALAREGVVFDHAYAVYPESIKGLLSVLCSSAPAIDRSVELDARLPCRSIAAELAKRGYRTALFHSGRFAYLGMDAVVRGRGFELTADAGEVGGNHESSFGVDEEATVARMLEWIDRVPRDERFFVMYLPIAGHHPYEVPRSGLARRSAEGAEAAGERTEFDRYLGALRYSDAALGSFITGIRERGLWDHTALIVFGDHGEAFGQHDGNFGHTFQIYEENVHVPLIVALPGRVHGPSRHASVVSLIDIAPTVLDLIGAPTPPEYEGTSLFDGAPREAMFLADYSLRLVGLRDRRFKVIHEIGSGRSQLFDLSSDPRETHDVADRDRDRVRRYTQQLEEWIR